MSTRKLNVSIPEVQFEWLKNRRDIKPSWIFQQCIQKLIDEDNKENAISNFSNKLKCELRNIRGSGSKKRPELLIELIIDNRTIEDFNISNPFLRLGYFGYLPGIFYEGKPFFERKTLIKDLRNDINIKFYIDFFAIEQLRLALQLIKDVNGKCDFSVNGVISVEHSTRPQIKFDINIIGTVFALKKEILDWFRLWELAPEISTL